MKIDAHQHFWRLEQNDCHWPTPDLAAIHRDFGPHDLAPLAAAAGVDGTVLVQSQPSDRDTDYLLALAARTPLVRAVVGWTDLKSSAAPSRIAALAAHPKLKGLRAMWQDEPAKSIGDPTLAPAIAAMQDHGLRLDALVRPHHLSALYRFAQRHPGLALVLDHGGKPDIAMGGTPGWQDGIATLAEQRQVFCKLSGLVTEAGPQWRADNIAPYVSHLLQSFGPERLMWGSDWPVLNLVSHYEEWRLLAATLVPSEAQDAVFGATAARFYGLAE